MDNLKNVTGLEVLETQLRDTDHWAPGGVAIIVDDNQC